MKKKIISIFCLLNAIICYASDLQHETTKEHYSTENESCKDICYPKYKQECHSKLVHVSIDDWETEEVCNTVSDGEDCHEECHTETEWHTIIKELETYDVTQDLRDEYKKSSVTGANQRYNIINIDDNGIPIESKFDKFKNDWSTRKALEVARDECAKHIEKGLVEYSRQTGNDLRRHTNEYGKEVISVRNAYIESKQNSNINQETRDKLHKMADSDTMRRVYHEEDNLAWDVKYDKVSDDRVVDPALKPIVKSENEKLTEEELKSNRPVFRLKDSKKEDSSSNSSSSTDWSSFDDDYHVNHDDGYKYYTYYSVTFDSNGATQGYTPSKLACLKDSYFSIPDNVGELSKIGYKFVGWNTSPNGKGITYYSGENVKSVKNMTLYAKWEKIEKIEVPKPIENKVFYSVSFIGGDHITLNGNTKVSIEKGKAIGYVPSVNVDNNYKFKHWLASNGNIYSNEQIKNFVPDDNINFMVIIESTKENTVVTPKPIPKPIKKIEKYNVTFTANEYSKLKGTTNLEVNENDVIGQVPSVIPEKGYEFKHWLGSDNKNYTNDEIKNLKVKNNISFLVVTKLKPIDEIKKPEIVKPELPKQDKTQTSEKTESKPTFTYVPIEVYQGDSVEPDDVVNKSTIVGFLVYWDKAPNTQILGKVPCSVKLMNIYTGKGWTDYPNGYVNVIAKPELSYKNAELEVNTKVTVDNTVNKTLSDRYEVVVINDVDTTTIGKKLVKYKVIDKKLNREFTGYETYINVIEHMESLPFEHDYVYVNDVVKTSDILNIPKIPSKYKVEIYTNANTNTNGVKPLKLKVTNPTSTSVWYVDYNVNVINKPTLNYKDNRRKPINTDILKDDIVESVTIIDYTKFNKNYYTYEITNSIDNKTIGTKVVELKVIDTHKNREFTGYTSDITLYENLDDLNYKDNPEIYIGDDTKVEDIIDNKDIPSKYVITIKVPANSSTEGIKDVIITIKNPTSNSVWEVTRQIKVLPKPSLVYKNPRRKHINLEITPTDVVENKLDKRYEIFITNDIDNKTIGTKQVILKVVDNKLHREFTGYTTDITLYEDLLDLNYKQNPQIYVGDNTKVEDIIDNKDIPSIYKITVKVPADSTSTGIKDVIITIKNPTSTSVWEVTRKIEVLPEPNLIGKDLWIYQNDKTPDDKGVSFIPKISVDLNERFKGRYKIEYKGHGDISKIGQTKFTYIITDLQFNRKFEKQVVVEVREETINPKINENLERYIGHIFTIDELVENIDKNIYVPEITNLDEMQNFRLTVGKKYVKVKITSTITGKVWTYEIPVIYKEKIVNLGELVWEKGEILTIEDIRKHKNLPTDHTITLRKGDLDTSTIQSKDLELVIMDKDKVYYVGILKLTIVENKTIEDIHKIDDGTKIHLISYVDDISNKAINKLLRKSKSNDLWIEQTNNFIKYTLDDKANIIGGKVGYDKYLDKQKMVLGAYVGYDRATWNLSSVSKQNMFHLGTYASKELYNKNNGKNKVFVGGVGQYTYINGDINTRNIRNEEQHYKQKSNNVLLNGFVGTSYEYSKDSNIAFNIGDTLLYSFNNSYIGKTQNIGLDNNLTNEVYGELLANKKWNKLNVHSGLKVGYLFGKTKYTLNNAIWQYTLRKFNIKLSGGADYSITNNLTVGVSGFYKYHDKSIKSDMGLKGNIEYKW